MRIARQLHNSLIILLAFKLKTVFIHFLEELLPLLFIQLRSDEILKASHSFDHFHHGSLFSEFVVAYLDVLAIRYTAEEPANKSVEPIGQRAVRSDKYLAT